MSWLTGGSFQVKQTLVVPARAKSADVRADLTRATEGYVYFNRPGADMAQHDSELKDCLNGRPQERYIVTGRGALIRDMMLKHWASARAQLNVETCMVVRGWRVMQLPAAEGVRLAALDQTRLVAELSPWVGSSTPPGLLMRAWANQAARFDTIVARSPSSPGQVLLSLQAMDPDAPPPAQSVLKPMYPASATPPPQAIPLGANELDKTPPGWAIVIARLTGSNRAIINIGGKDGPSMLWQLMAKPRHNNPNAGRTDGVQAFAVPPGRWGLLGTLLLTDYCLGAPAFEAKAGDVVFLGSFDFSREALQPDMSLEPIQGFLSETPGMTARVKPVAWVNGVTAPCSFYVNYALEFDGFPFEPGYEWGSRAPGR
jgi:hypothetical protein